MVGRGDCTAERDGDVLGKHPQLCKRGHIRWTCNITINVQSIMAPKFTVIVSQKYVSASRIAIDVIPDTSTQVIKEPIYPSGLLF